MAKQSILGRITQLLKANINSLIDQAEDPQLMLDQLVRDNGLAAARTSAIARALDAAEKATGQARKGALQLLARQVDGDVAGAKDGAKVKAMAQAIRDLAAATK